MSELETGQVATAQSTATGAQATQQADGGQTAASSQGVELDLTPLGETYKGKKIDQEAITSLLSIAEKDKDWKDNLKLFAGDSQLFGMYSKSQKDYASQMGKRLQEAGEAAKKAREEMARLGEEKADFATRVKSFEAMSGEAIYHFDPKVKEAKDKFAKLVAEGAMTQDVADMAVAPYIEAAKARAEAEEVRRTGEQRQLSEKIAAIAKDKLGFMPKEYGEAVVTDGVLNGLDADDAAAGFAIWLQGYVGDITRKAVHDALSGIQGQPKPTETKADTAQPAQPAANSLQEQIEMGRMHWGGMKGAATA